MKNKIKKARLIYNPTSGQEIIKKNIAEVLDVLEDVGYETSAYQTTPEPFSAQREAERAAKAGFDLVIAAGGDGTINEVVNGVASLDVRPKLAFIPTGTTNDYARALKIPMGDPSCRMREARSWASARPPARGAPWPPPSRPSPPRCWSPPSTGPSK